MIIVSAVRSSGDNVMADIRRNLGFVAEPRRFNGEYSSFLCSLMPNADLSSSPVAITRARALLIVIGNPQILALDPLWQSFMSYVHTGGGWRGRQINWNPPEAPTGFAGRVAKEQEEMMVRIRNLVATVERSDGFLVDEEYPEGEEEEEEEDVFVPERGTFAREDE